MSTSQQVDVLLVSPRPGWSDRVRAVEPTRLRVAELPGAEIAADGGGLYPPRGSASSAPLSSRDERDRLIRSAQVILLGLPYPTRLYNRAQHVQWVHHPNAGTSNLWQSDFWGAAVQMTSSRGSNAARPIAESVIAGALMFARGLHIGARGSMRWRDYTDSVTLAGKTMGIVGLGGIGRRVAEMARSLGMTVIATRRSAAVRSRDVDGAHEVFPARELHEMLARSDFVAVCVMLTRETTALLDRGAFSAMKTGAIVINVARGEVIDEEAMIAALEGGRLGGAYLDVFAGELSGSPPPQPLLDDPRVVMTPHVSGMADDPGELGIDLFLENLRNYLDGKPLHNVIDWDRGY